MVLPRALETDVSTPPKPAPPLPPPPLLVPEARWRLAPYLACVPPGGRHGFLTLDEVREITPRWWATSPRERLRKAGISHTSRHPRLRPDSAIWVRRAEPEEVQLGEAVRAAVQSGPQHDVGKSRETSWHLPAEYTGSGVLRRWRPALPGDKPEVLRTIRGQPWAPGEELVLQTGTSPARVAELVREWVKRWAPG